MRVVLLAGSRRTSRSASRSLLAAVSIAALSVGLSPASAQEPGDALSISIESETLSAALVELARETGVAIFAPSELTAGKTVRPLSGEMTLDAALAQLLEGTGLEALTDASGAKIVSPTVAPVPPAAPVGEREETQRPVETITVTGTSIRGFAPESSPLQVFTRDEILETGASSTEDFIRRAVPQNFNGVSTEIVGYQGLPTDISSQANRTLGSGANLRGLGSGATLTLLNGNRVAPSSSIGDFVDISMIPISATARIDVFSDGASSIYEGDAVAGVVTIVLRDDFDGAETTVRYGNTTSASLDEWRASQTLGTKWRGGSLLGTYEYFKRGDLVLSERPNIPTLSLNDGSPIVRTDLFDLLPKQERHSSVLYATQDLTPQLGLEASAAYSSKTVDRTGVTISATESIGSHHVEAEALTGSIGVNYEINSDWSVSFDTTYSESSSYTHNQIVLPTLRNPARSDFEAELWGADLLVSGSLFDLPAGDVRTAVCVSFRNETFILQNVGASPSSQADRDVAAAFAEAVVPTVGETNRIGGIERLELNVSVRLDDYSDFGETTNPKVGVLWSPIEGLNVRGSYSTSFAPPPLGRAGARNRNGAVIPYTYTRNLFGIELPDPSLADVNYLIMNGTEAELDPEISRTHTGGFDFDREFGAHFWTLRTTYYDIHFEDRLGQVPIPGNLNVNYVPGLAFHNPELFPEGTIIFFPTDEEIAATIATFHRPLVFSGGATAIENIGFINKALVTRNLGSVNTRGIDIQIDYDFDMTWGRLSAGFNANHILEFTQQASSTTPALETLTTLYNPVDLKLRGRVGVSRGGFSGTAM